MNSELLPLMCCSCDDVGAGGVDGCVGATSPAVTAATIGIKTAGRGGGSTLVSAISCICLTCCFTSKFEMQSL